MQVLGSGGDAGGKTVVVWYRCNAVRPEAPHRESMASPLWIVHEVWHFRSIFVDASYTIADLALGMIISIVRMVISAIQHGTRMSSMCKILGI